MGQIVEAVGKGYYFHYAITPKEKNQDFTLHAHSTYEIYYLINGRVEYIIEGDHYTLVPGSLLVISPGVIHGYKSDASRPYERCAFHFSGELFPEEKAKWLSLFSCKGKGRHYYGTSTEGIFPLLETLICGASLEEPLRQNYVENMLQALVIRLYSQYLRLSKGEFPLSERSREADIINYLNNNFTSNITLDTLVDRFFINKSTMNRLFKKATGTTVMEYIIRKRIVYAQQLMQKGLSANEAALSAGFGDYSCFYRAYIRINGHSPINDKSEVFVSVNKS